MSKTPFLGLPQLAARNAALDLAKEHVATTGIPVIAADSIAQLYLEHYSKNCENIDSNTAAYLAITQLHRMGAGLIPASALHSTLVNTLFGRNGSGSLYSKDISINRVREIEEALQAFKGWEQINDFFKQKAPEAILDRFDAGDLNVPLTQCALWHLNQLYTDSHQITNQGLTDDSQEQAAKNFFRETEYLWDLLIQNPGPNHHTRAGLFLAEKLAVPPKFLTYVRNLFGLRFRASESAAATTPSPTPEPMQQMTTAANTNDAAISHAPMAHPLKQNPTSEYTRRRIGDIYSDAISRETRTSLNTPPLITPRMVMDALKIAATANSITASAAAQILLDELRKIDADNAAVAEFGSIKTHVEILIDYLLYDHYCRATATATEAATLPNVIVRIARHVYATAPRDMSASDTIKATTDVLGGVLLRMANEILTPGGPASPIEIEKAVQAAHLPADIQQAITSAVAGLVAIPERFSAESKAADWEAYAASHQEHKPVGAGIFKPEDNLFQKPTEQPAPSAGGTYSRILKDDWQQAVKLLAMFDEIISQKPYLASTPNGYDYVLEVLATVAKTAGIQREDSVARAIVGAVMDSVVDTTMPLHANYRPHLAVPVAILVAYINTNRYHSSACVKLVDGAALLAELAGVLRFIGTVYRGDEAVSIMREVFEMQKAELLAKGDLAKLETDLMVHLSVVVTEGTYHQVQKAWAMVFGAAIAETKPYDGVFDEQIIGQAGVQLERNADEQGARAISVPVLDEAGWLTNPEVVRAFRQMDDQNRRGYLRGLDMGQKSALLYAIQGEQFGLSAKDAFEQALKRGDVGYATANVAKEPAVSEAGVTTDADAVRGLNFAPYDPATIAVPVLNVYGQEGSYKDVPAIGVSAVEDKNPMVAIVVVNLAKAGEPYRTTFPVELPGLTFAPKAEDFIHIETWAVETVQKTIASGNDEVFTASCNAIFQDPWGVDRHVIATVTRTDSEVVLKVMLASTDEFLRNDLPLLPKRQTLPGEVPSDLVAAAPVTSVTDEQMQAFQNAGPLVFKQFYKYADGAFHKEAFPFTHNEVIWQAGLDMFAHLIDWSGALRGDVLGLCNSTIGHPTGLVCVVAMSRVIRNEGLQEERVLEVRAQRSVYRDDSLPFVPRKASMPGEAPQVVPGDVLVTPAQEDGELVASFNVEVGVGITGSARLELVKANGREFVPKIRDFAPIEAWVNDLFASAGVPAQTETFAVSFTAGDDKVLVPVNVFAERISQHDQSTLVHVIVERVSQVPASTVVPDGVARITTGQAGALRDLLLAKSGLTDPGKSPALLDRRQELLQERKEDPMPTSVKAEPTLMDYAEELQHFLLDWVYTNRDMVGPKVDRGLMRGISERNRPVLDALLPEPTRDGERWVLATVLTNALYDSITSAVDFALVRVLGDKYSVNQVNWLIEYFRAAVAFQEVAVNKAAFEKSQAAKAESDRNNE